MSQSEPTPEERQRIVASIMRKVQDSTPESELEEISRKRNEVRDKVIAQMRPLVQAAVETSVISPHHAHSETGRALLMTTAAKLYMEQLRSLSREEAITLLSFEYASLTIEHLL